MQKGAKLGKRPKLVSRTLQEPTVAARERGMYVALGKVTCSPP